MRFANIRELKLETSKVLEMSKKNGPVVVTRRGKPIAILRTITSDDLSLNVSTLWNRLQVAAKKAGYGPDDVEKLIAQVRKGSNRK